MVVINIVIVSILQMNKLSLLAQAKCMPFSANGLAGIEPCSDFTPESGLPLPSHLALGSGVPAADPVSLGHSEESESGEQV